jgi:hypothetical protein
LLDKENEGLGLNMYNAWVTDPYAANAIHSEIVSDLEAIKKNIASAIKDQSGELIFSDIEVIIEKILSRDPIPNELASKKSNEVYSKLIRLINSNTEKLDD